MNGQPQKRHRSGKFFWIGLCVTTMLLLAGCGWRTETTTTGSTVSKQATPAATATSTSAQTPTTVNNQTKGTPVSVSVAGCPSKVTTIATSTPADVIARVAHNQKPVEARVGNMVELQLAFGQQWTGPAHAPTGLTLQQPAGYADQASKACVWRFVAKQAGSFQLDFQGRAICEKGHMCAQYILDNPVIVNVKA